MATKLGRNLPLGAPTHEITWPFYQVVLQITWQIKNITTYVATKIGRVAMYIETLRFTKLHEDSTTCPCGSWTIKQIFPFALH